jgi:hypothetical protein
MNELHSGMSIAAPEAQFRRRVSDIMGKGGAINVHKSTADVKTSVACGDMK